MTKPAKRRSRSEGDPRREREGRRAARDVRHERRRIFVRLDASALADASFFRVGASSPELRGAPRHGVSGRRGVVGDASRRRERVGGFRAREHADTAMRALRDVDVLGIRPTGETRDQVAGGGVEANEGRGGMEKGKDTDGERERRRAGMDEDALVGSERGDDPADDDADADGAERLSSGAIMGSDRDQPKKRARTGSRR